MSASLYDSPLGHDSPRFALLLPASLVPHPTLSWRARESCTSLHLPAPFAPLEGRLGAVVIPWWPLVPWWFNGSGRWPVVGGRRERGKLSRSATLLSASATFGHRSFPGMSGHFLDFRFPIFDLARKNGSAGGNGGGVPDRDRKRPFPGFRSFPDAPFSGIRPETDRGNQAPSTQPRAAVPHPP